MTDNPLHPTTSSPTGLALTQPSQVKALGHPLRNTILGLLHERAATVTELATAVERPKSTVAPPRQGARRGRPAPGRPDAAGAGDRGALLRPHGAHVLRRRSSRARRARSRRGTSTTSKSPRGESAAAFRDGEAVGLHPPRPHLGVTGVGVLGADGGARCRVRPAAAVGRHDVRVRGRRVPDRPAGATEQRLVPRMNQGLALLSVRCGEGATRRERERPLRSPWSSPSLLPRTALPQLPARKEATGSHS